MGLIKRIKMIVSSNINHGLDKMENPTKIAKELILEMKQKQDKAKAVYKETLAKHMSLTNTFKETSNKVENLDILIQNNISVGDEAKSIMLMKQRDNLIKYQEALKTQIEFYDNHISEIKNMIIDSSTKITELERKQSIMELKANVIKAKEQSIDLCSNLKSDSILENFKRMEDKLNNKEFQLKAEVKMHDDFSAEPMLLSSEEITDAKYSQEFKELRANYLANCTN